MCSKKLFSVSGELADFMLNYEEGVLETGGALLLRHEEPESDY